MENTITAQEAFNEKLEEIRKERAMNLTANRLRSEVAINDALLRESVATVTVVLKELYEFLDLEPEKLESFLKMARRSEYGRVPEMLAKIASLYTWPGCDVQDIADTQEDILDIINKYTAVPVTADLLMDIKESKGSHTFLSNTDYEVIDAIEPAYEEFKYYISTLADYLNLPYVDIKLSEEKWEKNELKALKRVAKEQEEAQKALEAHNALVSA